MAAPDRTGVVKPLCVADDSSRMYINTASSCLVSERRSVVPRPYNARSHAAHLVRWCHRDVIVAVVVLVHLHLARSAQMPQRNVASVQCQWGSWGGVLRGVECVCDLVW